MIVLNGGTAKRKAMQLLITQRHQQHGRIMCCNPCSLLTCAPCPPFPPPSYPTFTCFVPFVSHSSFPFAPCSVIAPFQPELGDVCALCCCADVGKDDGRADAVGELAQVAAVPGRARPSEHTRLCALEA